MAVLFCYFFCDLVQIHAVWLWWPVRTHDNGLLSLIVVEHWSLCIGKVLWTWGMEQSVCSNGHLPHASLFCRWQGRWSATNTADDDRTMDGRTWSRSLGRREGVVQEGAGSSSVCLMDQAARWTTRRRCMWRGRLRNGGGGSLLLTSNRKALCSLYCTSSMNERSFGVLQGSRSVGSCNHQHRSCFVAAPPEFILFCCSGGGLMYSWHL